MKNLLTKICRVGLLVGLACLALAADQMWTGQVSDSVCGANHEKMIAGHPGMSERDCVLACVYNIANQGLALLETHAGHTVRLTGETRATQSRFQT